MSGNPAKLVVTDMKDTAFLTLKGMTIPEVTISNVRGSNVIYIDEASSLGNVYIDNFDAQTRAVAYF